MFCQKCGNQLQEEATFCYNCGEKQVEQTANNIQSQPVYVVPLQKPLKKPSTSIILNLIAVFLFILSEIYAIFNTDGGSHFQSNFKVYLIIIPLILSIAILLFQKTSLKIVFSALELGISIFIVMIVFTYSGEVIFPLAGAILQIVAASRNLSYSTKLKRFPEFLDDNKKKNKILKIISASLLAIIVILGVVGSIPRATKEDREIASPIIDSISILPELSIDTVKEWENILNEYDELSKEQKKLIKNRKKLLTLREQIPILISQGNSVISIEVEYKGDGVPYYNVHKNDFNVVATLGNGRTKNIDSKDFHILETELELVEGETKTITVNYEGLTKQVTISVPMKKYFNLTREQFCDKFFDMMKTFGVTQLKMEKTINDGIITQASFVDSRGRYLYFLRLFEPKENEKNKENFSSARIQVNVVYDSTTMEKLKATLIALTLPADTGLTVPNVLSIVGLNSDVQAKDVKYSAYFKKGGGAGGLSDSYSLDAYIKQGIKNN